MSQDRVLDVRGLECPMPIIRVKKEMAAVPVGGVLEVWATDPGSLADVPAWTRTAGHELMRVEDQAAPFKFWIRRGR